MLSSLFFRKKTMDSSSSSPSATTTTTGIIRTPKQSTQIITREHLGLKTLANTSTLDRAYLHPNCVNRNILIASSRSPSLSQPPPLPPPPSRSEDEISVVFDTQNDDAFEEEEEKEEEEGNEEDTDGCCWATYGRRRTELLRRFPPPIPLLARTGNLTSHMPWVLKRIYRDDGSLVLQEVRVKRHEYFRATRVDGRLSLHLVELDDQSPLFASGPQRDNKEDGPQSSSSAMLYPIESEEEKDCADEKVDHDHEDLEIEREKINDIQRDPVVGTTSSLRSQMAAKMNMFSSSLPERVCGNRWTSLHRWQVKGTPVVRGY